MIDTHCHLTFNDLRGEGPKTAGGIPRVLALAASHGVTGCITISTTTPDALDCMSIASQFDRVWFSAGVHPLYADQGPHHWADLASAGMHPKCVAWGELGLDKHYKDPPLTLQQQVLDEQLDFIRAQAQRGMAKPIILHCREAFADLIPILKSSGLPPDRMVFHCFTGTLEDMSMLIDFGAWVSFTGVLTYKNGEEIRQAAKLAPIDRIMVETDAPFLSPEPHRSTRPCQPWMVSITAQTLAAIHGLSTQAMHEQLNANTQRFFGIC